MLQVASEFKNAGIRKTHFCVENSLWVPYTALRSERNNWSEYVDTYDLRARLLKAIMLDVKEGNDVMRVKKEMFQPSSGRFTGVFTLRLTMCIAR